VITFRVEPGTGVAPYLQIVQQVRQALRVGMLREGDQLPPVREVVAQLAINPNTVLKAYRELEHEGLADVRQGIGTFVTGSPALASLQVQARLRPELARWLSKACRAGLGEEDLRALFDDALRAALADAA
jgi:GntR family transcriptional regulator